MTPHCDTLDGPVVQAAKKAIEQVNVLYVLPWVPAEAEQEVRDAFEDVMHAREKGEDPCKVADRWFFETVVRLHLQGEGKPFTGLKPAEAGRKSEPVINDRLGRSYSKRHHATVEGVTHHHSS